MAQRDKKICLGMSREWREKVFAENNETTAQILCKFGAGIYPTCRVQDTQT